MTKIEILKKALEMANHNLLCYSGNYLRTKPREGYEKEWREQLEEVEVLESILEEIENPPVVKITLDALEKALMRMKQQRQYHNMSSNIEVRICKQKNGRQCIELEQSSPYAECNSHYERLNSKGD